MAKLLVDNVHIDYDDKGSGEPALLFMTAWCMSRSIYSGITSLTSKHRRTLALDWRGHGASDVPAQDFGAEQLITDAIALIEESGAEQVVPVSSSHAGWVAIELRNRLGDRIPKIILLDWLLFPAPNEYMDLVWGLAASETWESTMNVLFDIWLEGVDNQGVIDFVKNEMGSYGEDTWRRSGREIGGCYERGGSPIRALQAMEPHIPVLHLYAQPDDPAYLEAQQDFDANHPWFTVKKLQAKSHFPSFEVPEEMAAEIEAFVRG